MSNVFASTVTETSLFEAMSSVSQQKTSNVIAQIRKSIANRAEYEASVRDDISADFESVQALDNPNVARFFAVIGLAPEFYINSASYTPEEFEKRSRIPREAKTKSLKAYKKMRETAEYFANGSHLENVVKTFVACSIISSQYHATIPRDVCERFLSSIPLNRVSDELIEALDHYRAKHMSGGAATQTSQCTLQLANMRAANVIRNGRHKDFALDVQSVVVESFAQKFGLTAELDKARAYRARLDAEAVAA